jgi:hypothetical protein
MSDLVRRSELLTTYAHPYRRWLPIVLRGYGVQRVAALAVALAVVGGIVKATTEFGDGLLVLGFSALVVALGYALWATLKGVRIVRDHTEEWRGRGGDLARARARRPHAGDADPEAAHDEYAVAVSDDGRLVTFAYTPLAAHEEAAPETVLIRGIPRYAAVEHSVARYDPVDAARAAEQLAEAQEHAARLEAAAIERTLQDLAHDDQARELLAETRSTGAALRDITGQ